MMLWLHSGAPHLYASKDYAAPNPGFVTEFAASIEDVLQALQEVLQDQTIHGTQMFDRGPTRESTPLFEPWKGEGKVSIRFAPMPSALAGQSARELPEALHNGSPG